ncbi:hypothetical protein CR513_09591, partial [Mucuna pruriens]
MAVLKRTTSSHRRGNSYKLEATNLCLILDVGFPADFKTLEFDKYKGISCPRHTFMTTNYGFEDQAPNVQSNPLPAHRNVAINTISHDSNKRAEKINGRQRKGSTTKHVVNPSNRLRTYNRPRTYNRQNG